MKRIKAVLGKKWTYLLLLVALGWIFWLWILPYRYTAMALWGIAGTVGVYDLLARLGAQTSCPCQAHEAAVYRLPLSDPGAYDCNGRTGTLRRRGSWKTRRAPM